MIFLTSTTPAPATASAFPSSAEEGSCDSRVGQQPRKPWVLDCGNNAALKGRQTQPLPPLQGRAFGRHSFPGLAPWARDLAAASRLRMTLPSLAVDEANEAGDGRVRQQLG